MRPQSTLPLAGSLSYWPGAARGGFRQLAPLCVGARCPLRAIGCRTQYSLFCATRRSSVHAFVALCLWLVLSWEKRVLERKGTQKQHLELHSAVETSNDRLRVCDETATDLAAPERNRSAREAARDADVCRAMRADRSERAAWEAKQSHQF